MSAIKKIIQSKNIWFFPYIFWSMLAVAFVLSFMVADEIENRLTSIEKNLDVIESALEKMPKK